jgi:hypothetical protein
VTWSTVRITSGAIAPAVAASVVVAAQHLVAGALGDCHHAAPAVRHGVPVVRAGALKVLSGIAVTSLPVASELAVALA